MDQPSPILNFLSQPDLHETRLRQHFGDQVRFLPGERIGDRLAILLFTNRSGSNLLADYLVKTGRFSGLTELLNWEDATAIATRHGITRFPDLLRNIYLHNTADGRLFGVKASANQLLTLHRWGALAAFDSVRIIRITRRDLIAQAVSLSIARQTGQWTADLPAQAPAAFRPDDILTEADTIAEQLRLQDIILATLDLPVLDVTYEDLTAAPAATLSRVMHHFGLPDDLPPPQTGLAPQADSRNADFIARIRSYLRAAMTGD
jgi:trehalose 2-sulfotransferase